MLIARKRRMVRLWNGKAKTALDLRTERIMDILVQRPRKYLEWRELKKWKDRCPPKRRCRSSVCSLERVHDS